MDWNGVAAEGVNRQHVKVLWLMLLQFSLQRDSSVSQHNIHVCWAVFDIGEVRPGARREFYNLRIDFIAAKGVSRLSIGSKGANAQTNNSNPEASFPYTSKTTRVVEQGQADSALATIIGGWEVTSVFSLVLQSVGYPSMP